jgi:uncharacterized OB-fold protein
MNNSGSKCDGCGRVVPPPEIRYVSPMSDTYKPTVVDGVPGTENIPKNVCIECFRTDFAVKYPGSECPV